MPNKIMVVDDEENLLILLKGLLESHGFDAVTMKNGRECLDAIEREKPDLLILDVMMPEMNGLDVAGKIRANPKTKKTMIIFLTVLGSKEINHKTLRKLKAIDYITKPFDNEDLIRRVKWAISK